MSFYEMSIFVSESRDSGTVPGLTVILVPRCRDLCPAGFYYRDCPGDFCPGTDCPAALSPGPGPNPGDSRDRDRDPVKSRDNRPSLVLTTGKEQFVPRLQLAKRHLIGPRTS